MTRLGQIKITDKVIFEYYELEKPPPSYESGYHLGYRELKLKEYEASKRSVEVSNVFWGELCEKWFYEDILYYDDGIVKNRDFCKAEITKNTCIIIELIKE